MKVIGGGGISVKGERSMELVAPSKGQCLTTYNTAKKTKNKEEEKARAREREREKGQK